MKFIKKQYIRAVSHIKEMRLFLVISAVMFVLSWLCGYLLALAFPKKFDTLFEMLSGAFAQNGIYNEESVISALSVFFNNSRASLLAIIYGLVPFLFLTSWSVLLNGGIIGMVLGVSQNSGVNVLLGFVTGILPHGIFEIPALILSWGTGMYLCFTMIKRILRKTDSDGFAEALIRTLAVYCCLILPLLVAAAVVETFVTPYILEFVM